MPLELVNSSAICGAGSAWRPRAAFPFEDFGGNELEGCGPALQAKKKKLTSPLQMTFWKHRIREYQTQRGRKHEGHLEGAPPRRRSANLRNLKNNENGKTLNLHNVAMSQRDFAPRALDDADDPSARLKHALSTWYFAAKAA